MKKLILTTALIGSTLVAGNAIAQTSITGSMMLSYKASDSQAASGTTTNSGRGFGNEQQINVQNKGKLNNGMDYAAGFSIENDGGQSTTLFNENVYIDFIAGNTTFTIGQDHIQNSDRSVAALIGMEATDLASGVNGTGIFLGSVGSDPAASYHFGIIQTIPGVGKLSALYAPSDMSTQSASSTEKNFIEDDNESAYEIGFVGDFGVKGLNTYAFYNVSDTTTHQRATSGNVNDLKGNNIGISYNFGSTTIGIDRKENKAITNNADTKQVQIGVANAVSPQLSVGAFYAKSDKEGTAADAKAKFINIGYNLGPVALVAQFGKLENITGTANVDADVAYLRALTTF